MSNMYGRQTVLPLVNKSGGVVIAGDVVIIDTANDGAFTTTTVAQSQKSVGVAQETIASNATGRILVSGYAALVNVQASVTRGHYLETYSVAKQGNGNSTRRAGTFGQFLTGGTTPTAWLWGFPDNAGAAGSTVATDTIWDAAGDLAVGTGADTAAKLTKGAAGGALSMINAAVAWNSGTSFPGSAVAGDRYWRTDRGREYYYDGTRWLSTDTYAVTMPLTDAAINGTVAATGVVGVTGVPWFGTYSLWLDHVDFGYQVSTNSGSNYWTFDLNYYTNVGGRVNIVSANTSALAASSNGTIAASIAALLNAAGVNFELRVSKTGTPANLFAWSAIVLYRLVG